MQVFKGLLSGPSSEKNSLITVSVLFQIAHFISLSLLVVMILHRFGCLVYTYVFFVSPVYKMMCCLVCFICDS